MHCFELICKLLVAGCLSLNGLALATDFDSAAYQAGTPLWISSMTEHVEGSLGESTWILNPNDAHTITGAVGTSRLNGLAENQFLQNSGNSEYQWLMLRVYGNAHQFHMYGSGYKMQGKGDRASPQSETVVNESETYAMILTGLGLFGFSARHRKEEEYD